MNRTNKSSDSLSRGAKCKECDNIVYDSVEICEECGSDELDEEWNSLKTNYKSHDYGEQATKALLRYHGFHVENWGIDRREEDENLIYDDKMDFRVWESTDEEELVCIMDVKTKNNEAWTRRYNKRHHDKYYQWVEKYDVPVYVIFCILDDDTVEETSLFPLHHYPQEEGYSCTFTFPDGNEGVYIPVDHVSDWSLFRGECL